MSSSNLAWWGALGAVLAGVAWVVSGIIDVAIAGGQCLEIPGFAPLDEAVYVIALVGTLGGLVGLHARQAPRYGLPGTAGFLAAFTGCALLLVGIMLTFLARGNILGWTFADLVLGLGFLGTLVGLVLLGAATLGLGVLPQWCGILLIICLPVAVILGNYGGGIVLGLVWLALGYVLLSQQDVSALVRGSEDGN